jgi:hypothetical protein
MVNQNAGWSHSIKIDNSSFERVEKFQFFGTPFTNQNSVQEENHSTLQSGNACCHPVKNPLSSCLLSKIMKIKRSIVWVWKLVSQLEGGTYAEEVPE